MKCEIPALRRAALGDQLSYFYTGSYTSPAAFLAQYWALLFLYRPSRGCFTPRQRPSLRGSRALASVPSLTRPGSGLLGVVPGAGALLHMLAVDRVGLVALPLACR